MKVSFEVNGEGRVLDVPPLRRLLDILREDLGLTGTKEGCGEGECGACAVLMDDALVDACLVPAVQLAGRRIVTIEGLGSRERPDPVQQAFLEEGAAQCGFCIPGMVMASRALLNRCPQPSREEIRVGLAGNLCRCTGYERIIRAVQRAASLPAASGQPASIETVPASRTVTASVDGIPAYAPDDLREALEILQTQRERITIIAGATDLLTDVKLGNRRPAAVLDITRLASLRGIALTEQGLEIGATTEFAQVARDERVRRHAPALADAAATVGAAAIQNRATLGGNLMTASPAADAPPVLMALNATVTLTSAKGTREVPVDSFFVGYRRCACRPEELLSRVSIPLPSAGDRQCFYKVGTRLAQSISKVCVACRAQVDAGGVLSGVRVAAGSVAPTPVSLPKVARYLEGRRVQGSNAPEVMAAAGSIAAREIAPIDDVRSSAAYRSAVTRSLVVRFLQEIAGS